MENVRHTHQLPPKLNDLLTRALEDHEQVIWFEQPDVQRWRRKGYLAVPFGLAISALVWHASTKSLGGWFWGIAFLMVPAVFFVALPWIQHARAKSTLYVLTNRRALILTNGIKHSLRSYRLPELPDLTVRPRRDGSGDIILETEEYKDGDGDLQTREHGFEDIRDVGLVQLVLDNLKSGMAPELVRRHAALWRLAS